MSRIARALPLVLLGLSVAATALAAEPEDVKRAEALFHDGQRLLKAGQIPAACDAFAQSQRLDPAVGTLLNLADCHAQARRFATAHAEFMDAARRARETGQKDREVFALEQAALSEAVLSLIEVQLPPGVDAVTIDDAPVPRAALARPIPLDPGPHVLVASAAAKPARSLRIEVGNGPSKQIVVVPAFAAIEPVHEAPKPAPDARGLRIAGLAVAGAGVVALGLGALFGLRASGKKSDAEAHCVGRFCDPDGLQLQNDAHSAATISTVAFAVGAVAALAGGYLYFSVPRPSRGIARARVAPTAFGVRVEAAW